MNNMQQCPQLDMYKRIKTALIPVVGRLKIILRSRSNRKNKTSGSVVPGSFKIFQNSFESLGFIHVFDALKQQAINHIDIINRTHIMLLIS